MVVVVVILGLIAVAAIVAAIVASRRLGSQRTLTAAAEERATQKAAELATAQEAAERSGRDAAAAEQWATASAEAAVVAEEQVQLVEQRAAAAEAARDAAEVDRDDARRGCEVAAELQRVAEERAVAAEQRVAELESTAATAMPASVTGDGPDQPAHSASADDRVDAALLWTLERARSERQWRHSVAPMPDAESVFTDDAGHLIEALQIELGAAREEVGAVVELEADLPTGVTIAGSVLTLRLAQELLASVVRRAEDTTLVVRADGSDVLVSIRAVDEDGERIHPEPLDVAASGDVEVTENGVRIRNVVSAPIAG